MGTRLDRAKNGVRRGGGMELDMARNEERGQTGLRTGSNEAGNKVESGQKWDRTGREQGRTGRNVIGRGGMGLDKAGNEVK